MFWNTVCVATMAIAGNQAPMFWGLVIFSLVGLLLGMAILRSETASSTDRSSTHDVKPNPSQEQHPPIDLASIVELLNDLVLVLDKSKRVCWANPAAVEVFGRDITGQSFTEIFPAESQATNALNDVFAGQALARYLELWWTGSNTRRLFAWWFRAVKQQDGSVNGVVACARDITLQREILEQVRVKESHSRAVITATRDAVVMVNGQGKIVLWNRAAEELFGYSETEVLGRDPHELLASPEDLQRYRKAFANFQRTGTGAAVGNVVELEAIRRDGKRIPIELSLAAVQFGGQWHAIAVIRDISARKRMERLLENKLRQLQCLYSVARLLENTDADFQQVLQQVIEAVCQGMPFPELSCGRIVLFGDVVATSNYEETPWKVAAPLFVGGSLAGAIEVCYSRMPDTGPESNFSVEMQSWLESIADQVSRLVEQFQYQKQIRDLQRQIEFVLEATGTGLDIIDEAGNIVYVDPAWQARYGPPDGKKCYEYFMQRNSPCPNCGRAKALATGKRVVTEHTLPAEDNRPVQVISIPFKDEQGRRLVAEVVTDISERKRMEQELARAQKLESVGRLAAGIAHEINTPIQYIGDNLRFIGQSFAELRPLLSYLKQVGDSSNAPETSAEVFAKIREMAAATDVDFLLEEIPSAIEQSLSGIDSVTKIVRAMKEFAHPGTGQKQPININEAITSTLVVCRNEWKYVAEVETDFAEPLPVVYGYPMEINQCILNLVVNAAQAIAEKYPHEADKKGKITVRTRNLGDSVEIRVEDNGPGIKPELIEKIFDPFFTTKEVGKGTGQGLAIVHSTIVEKHGGSIRVESEPGRGATFIITLPAELENCQK